MPLQTTTIRPYSWRYLIPLVLSIFMIAVIGPKSGAVIFTILGVVLGVISIFLVVFFNTTRLTLDNQGLIFKTMISTREYAWENITNTYIKYQRMGKSGSNFWHFETATGKPLAFSIRDYSKKDLKLLAEAVTEKCRTAQIDGTIVILAR